MNTKVILAIVVVVLLLGGGAYFLSQNKATAPAATEVTSAPVQEALPTAMEESPEDAMGAETTGTVKEFTVTGSSFKFAPATLTVNKGDTVRITFKSTSMMHDFVIDELNVKSEVLPSGETEVIEFTADQAGTFEYYCSVGNHRQMGMVGTLTVKE